MALAVPVSTSCPLLSPVIVTPSIIKPLLSSAPAIPSWPWATVSVTVTFLPKAADSSSAMVISPPIIVG
ncbi:hypothetical protein D3C75_472810 [compost metagenome]